MHYPEVGFTHSEMLPYEHLDLTIEGPQGCTSNGTTTRSRREMLRYLQMLESPQADPIPGGTEGLRHEPLSVPSFPSQLLWDWVSCPYVGMTMLHPHNIMRLNEGLTHCLLERKQRPESLFFAHDTVSNLERGGEVLPRLSALSPFSCLLDEGEGQKATGQPVPEDGSPPPQAGLPASFLQVKRSQSWFPFWPLVSTTHHTHFFFRWPRGLRTVLRKRTVPLFLPGDVSRWSWNDKQVGNWGKGEARSASLGEAERCLSESQESQGLSSPRALFCSCLLMASSPSDLDY